MIKLLSSFAYLIFFLLASFPVSVQFFDESEWTPGQCNTQLHNRFCKILSTWLEYSTVIGLDWKYDELNCSEKSGGSKNPSQSAPERLQKCTLANLIFHIIFNWFSSPVWSSNKIGHAPYENVPKSEMMTGRWGQ